MQPAPAVNPAVERANQMRAKLIGIQAPLGLLAIIAGILYIVL
jgi:hypothetical protein